MPTSNKYYDFESFENNGLDYRYFVSYYRGKDKKRTRQDGKVLSEEAEIDFIIEQDGILYPIEIKKSSHVTADMTSAFRILDEIPEKKRGMGITFFSSRIYGFGYLTLVVANDAVRGLYNVAS